MALLPVQKPGDNSVLDYSVPDALGDEFFNDGACLIVALLDEPETLTIVSPIPGFPDRERVINSGFNILSRISPLRWNDPVTNRVTITWTNPQNVQHAILEPLIIGFDDGEGLAGSLKS